MWFNPLITWQPVAGYTKTASLPSPGSCLCEGSIPQNPVLHKYGFSGTFNTTCHQAVVNILSGLGSPINKAKKAPSV